MRDGHSRLIIIGDAQRELGLQARAAEPVASEPVYSTPAGSGRYEEVRRFNKSDERESLRGIIEGFEHIWPSRDFDPMNGGRAYIVFGTGGYRAHLLRDGGSFWLADRKGKVMTPEASKLTMEEDGRLRVWGADGVGSYDKSPSVADRIALKRIVPLEPTDDVHGDIRIKFVGGLPTYLE